MKKATDRGRATNPDSTPDERRAASMYAVALTDILGRPFWSTRADGETVYLARGGLKSSGVGPALKFGTAADATCWVEANGWDEPRGDHSLWVAVVGVLPRAMAEAEARAREEWEHRGTAAGADKGGSPS